jgi:hypothetical protein
VIGSLYAATKPKYRNNKFGTRYENSTFQNQTKQNKNYEEKGETSPFWELLRRV